MFQVKARAKASIFRSATAIVEEVLSELPADSQNVPNAENLKRRGNRARQQQRPQEPSDLDFEVSSEETQCQT